MSSHRRMATGIAASFMVLLAACTSEPSEPRSARPVTDDTVTVGSFDFAESEMLAELYSQALEAGGYDVRRAFNLGPREFVAPALVRGLIDMVPEYAGTAVQFLSLGSVRPGADVGDTHAALVRALEQRGVTALAPAPAQDANTFVVTRRVAERHALSKLSDVDAVGSQLTFAGPPECSARPLCLVGLEQVYGIRFREVVSLDAGGPLTRQALRDGVVDMALLFTTDPAVGSEGLVELTDDRGLQPAENVTPLVRTDALDRSGPRLAELIDAVSRRLATDDLRNLNALVTGGADVTAVAADWLKSEALR
ncbi:MAG: ABC transporter substrate-binding protein [Acidimicrobiales bacterium]